jgi:hypothetical protein
MLTLRPVYVIGKEGGGRERERERNINYLGIFLKFYSYNQVLMD